VNKCFYAEAAARGKKNKVGTLVHDGCQARQLEGKQGKGREGPPEEMRWATTEEVDSDDATMTRKTRNGKVFGTLGSQWCVRAGVDAEEAPGPASEQ
jgi:hypothetical protein